MEKKLYRYPRRKNLVFILNIDFVFDTHTHHLSIYNQYKYQNNLACFVWLQCQYQTYKNQKQQQKIVIFMLLSSLSSSFQHKCRDIFLFSQ
ncbi:hypothetical protein DERF_008282 [Dermatophagoides farinae]|uniref:Uncharacterized protein n=1 Tax=Dermatophagoides farinae TaxID=6954 RepID=A0A922I225_DERFA|nr:hypothetical protein DERF_008282 [Dermatophagoides farinae]